MVFTPSEAQLITDSKSKLKTAKVKREKGFLFFKKKKGKSATPPGVGKGAPTPKYSQSSAGSLFRNIKISPKYSTVSVGSSQRSGSPYPRYSKPISFRGARFPGAARYSQPVNWKGTRYAGSPKYSRPVNWKGTRYASAPRYSRPIDWKGAIYPGAPRYSKPVNWKGTRYASAPRYSRPINWKGAIYPGAPRYSKPVNWKGTRYASAPRYSRPINWKGAIFPGTPRYSRPVNWKGTQYAGSPRYSRPISWKGAKFAGTPRYSQPNNWKGAYIPGAPRYTSFKHRFYVDERLKEQSRPYTPWLDEYAGFMKYKKPHHKNMHPSVNYLTAKNVTSKNIKRGLRKWNVFWVQLNPGKISPKGLRNVAKKSKFDKKEKDIWNNGRDKKPTTRNDVTTGAEEVDNSAENDKNNP